MAQFLCDLFGWKVRWSGAALGGGRSVHVGADESYLALYTGPAGAPRTDAGDSYSTRGGLNHIGVVVDDLDGVEAALTARGIAAHSHADYEPGRRFYFDGPEGIEIEVVHYD